VIPVLTDDSPDSLAARLSPMEHRLVVATVEFFTRNLVECSEGFITVDGENLTKPLRLQADDALNI